jgi:hypothetical protein
MASALSIGRLHRAGEQDQPEHERVKLSNFDNSQVAVSAPPRERSMLARFARGREEAAYTLDRAEVMATLQPGAPADRGAAFAELANRERLAQELRRLVAGSHTGWLQEFVRTKTGRLHGGLDSAL